jgi:hypothetical protein
VSTETAPPRTTPEAALTALLSADRRALVIALDDEGFRIALPDHPEFAGVRTVLPSPDRGTLLDFVVPGDRVTVFAAWDRAKRSGGSDATVRPFVSAQRPARLVLLDLRHRFGTWIAVLAEVTGNATMGG